MVLPLPPNRSNTRSPRPQWFRIARQASSAGFWVGCWTSLLGSSSTSQQSDTPPVVSVMVSPLFSRRRRIFFAFGALAWMNNSAPAPLAILIPFAIETVPPLGTLVTRQIVMPLRSPVHLGLWPAFARYVQGS